MIRYFQSVKYGTIKSIDEWREDLISNGSDDIADYFLDYIDKDNLNMIEVKFDKKEKLWKKVKI